jgi:hypothetical protein
VVRVLAPANERGLTPERISIIDALLWGGVRLVRAEAAAV